MEPKQLGFKGIRRNSPAGNDDGACDELINMRFTKGAWRPVLKKAVVSTAFSANDYLDYYIHRLDSGENWVAWDGVDLKLIRNKNGWASPVTTIISVDNLVRIVSLKNFLILVLTNEVVTLLWDGSQYRSAGLDTLKGLFDIVLTSGGAATQTNVGEPPGGDSPERFSSPESLLGAYYKKIREYSDDEYFFGAVAYVVALRLFDGSYLLHSVPRVFHPIDYNVQFYRELAPVATGANASTIVDTVAMRVNASKIVAVATRGLLGSDFETVKKLVSSIDVFFSPITSFFQIDEDTITEDLFDGTQLPNTKVWYNASNILPISKEFKDMQDQLAWYKVGSVEVEKLRDVSSYVMELDVKSFYTNYATKRTLPIDNYTHHASSGQSPLVYNSRLWLGNTIQKLGDPLIKFEDRYRPLVENTLPIGYTEYHADPSKTFNFRFEVTLSTGSGVKTTVTEMATNKGYIPATITPGNPSTKSAFFLNGIVGYFDDRATNIKGYMNVGGSWYKVLDRPLSKSMYSNYSYIETSGFDPLLFNLEPNGITTYGLGPKRYDKNHGAVVISVDTTLLITPSGTTAEDNTTTDRSNVQISEVNNPLVFNVANYQQVGEETVLELGTNVDPISSSQFGQFPVYAFTSNGVKALEISASGPIVSRVSPLNEDVLLEQSFILNTSNGTAYITAEGLKLLIGNKDYSLSELVEGEPDENVTDNPQLQFFLNHPKTVNVINMVDKVNFEKFLEGAKLGYCKTKDSVELYIANPAYDYSYVYDIESKSWYKLEGKIYHFIYNFPNLMAVRADGIVELSKESAGPVQVYIQTRPLSLGSSDTFKKLRRSFLRCKLGTTPGKYASFYIFSSDDLHNWVFQCGNDQNTGNFKDIWITHSWGSARYFVIVVAAELNGDGDQYIKGVELIDEIKWTGNLR